MSEIKSGVKVEKEIPNPMQDSAEEVATDSQNTEANPSPEVGQLIAESKKYRSRAQSAEDELAKLQKRLEADKEAQLAEQNKWQELAESRAVKLQEQEPVIEAAMKQGYIATNVTKFTNDRDHEILSTISEMDEGDSPSYSYHKNKDDDWNAISLVSIEKMKKNGGGV